ncbi:MAG: HNH endonuclease signature motif containing protein [Clostridiales bacterium]|nr:HNH endonuclease signature motif containing protein [Clostridiales bacterium]MDU1041580.1 HNH endonuclease signature motif containing protein [Clostridiales bacterium]
MIKHTEEQHKFLREFIPGHTYKEIIEAFFDRFGIERTSAQIKSYIGNHKLSTGLTGRFEKGHIPANKGKKGYCSPGCEKTWFKKGHIPKNYRPVGSERVTQDGYVEIKVSDPNEWELKHRVVWEEANGPINKDECLLFRDNNRQNCCIDNLILVKRYEQVRMNQDGLFRFVGEEKDVAVNIARLKSLTRRRRRNKGGV